MANPITYMKVYNTIIQNAAFLNSINANAPTNRQNLIMFDFFNRNFKYQEVDSEAHVFQVAITRAVLPQANPQISRRTMIILSNINRDSPITLRAIIALIEAAADTNENVEFIWQACI